jgi:glycosyltransferase involved in cell wall biosynthesis
MMPRKQRPTVGVVIRFKNASATLPAVLAALGQQSLQPDVLVGIDSGCTDESRQQLEKAGASILDWHEPYHHARVLNHALRHSRTDLVLVLSSHTVLKETDALERLVEAMADPQVACASAKWDADPFYSDAIGWDELRAKGLKIGSIYSNSMGLVRRARWEELPFEEGLPTMEDGAWALEMARRGNIVRRLPLAFDYRRSGMDRSFTFALVTFKLAARHGLRVAWLGRIASVQRLILTLTQRCPASHLRDGRTAETRLHLQRLWASLTWRWRRMPVRE